MDQPKFERLLRIMKMLTTNRGNSVSYIADQLGMSSRTVYRYIDTFREAGFIIKKRGDNISLDKSSPYFRDISDLIHFTDEEAYILKSAIESIDENNLLKQNLKKKLYTVYDYKILADTVVSGKNAQNVGRLVDAIENKQKVVLCNYSSAHGSDIRNREVEPFAFTTNYVQVWCYCPEENTNKLFKVSRIGSVEVLSQNWEFAGQHKSGYIDIFRINSTQLYPLRLKLNLRAVSLLTEEYPLASKYLKKIADNEWLLETDICSFDGAGRFVMGLLQDVEVIDSPEFQAFITDRLTSYLNQ